MPKKPRYGEEFPLTPMNRSLLRSLEWLKKQPVSVKVQIMVNAGQLTQAEADPIIARLRAEEAAAANGTPSTAPQS
jgi:hypothetical protein